MIKRYRALAVPIIFEIAIILRVWGLGQAQLWYDESFTLLVARLDLPRLVLATAGDVHPPLWYLIEWLVIRLLGETALAMRLPSLVFSVWGLYLFYLIGLRLQVSRPGLLAGLAFLAINGTHIWYAQEARMYSLLMVVVELQTLSILNRKWLTLAAATLAGLYLHNYALVYSAVLAVWAIYREHKSEENLLKLFGAFLAAGLFWLPWLVVLYNQMATVAAAYWITPYRLGTVIYCLSAITWSFVSSDPIQSLSPLVFLGALTLAVIRSIQRKENGLLIYLSLAPLAVVLVVSALFKPVLLFRGLIGCVPALVLWISERLAGARQPVIYRWMAAAFALPIILNGMFTLWAKYPEKGRDAALIETYITPEYRPGDLLLHINDGSMVIFSAYSDIEQMELATPCPVPDGALSELTRDTLGFKTISIDQALAQYDRVFLIGGVGSTSTGCEETRIKELTAQAVPLYRSPDQYIYGGIWRIENVPIYSQTSR